MSSYNTNGGSGFFLQQDQAKKNLDQTKSGYVQKGSGTFRDENDTGIKTLSCIIPVTIKQINQASNIDGQVYINNVAPSHITIVACITNINTSPSFTNFTVDDGTGELTVKRWINDHTTPSNDLSSLYKGVYVRFIGDIKNIDGHMILTANKLIRVLDSNEISYHICDSIAAYHRARLNASQNGNISFGLYPRQKPYQSFDNKQPGAHASNDGLSMLQHQILNFIQNANATQQGASITSCIQQFGTAAKEIEIRKIIDGFLCEGLLYSTIDENHFKTVD